MSSSWICSRKGVCHITACAWVRAWVLRVCVRLCASQDAVKCAETLQKLLALYRENGTKQQVQCHFSDILIMTGSVSSV